MHTQLEAIGEQAEDYKQMQDTFHISQYEFTQLRDTISQYKLKIEIWSKLDTWNKSMKEWKSADFLGLDVEKMVGDVAAYFKDVHKMVKRLPQVRRPPMRPPTRPPIRRPTQLVEHCRLTPHVSHTPHSTRCRTRWWRCSRRASRTSSRRWS